MKRVKESFFREHPLWNNTEGCSGAKEFEGEDLGKDIVKNISRKKGNIVALNKKNRLNGV